MVLCCRGFSWLQFKSILYMFKSLVFEANFQSSKHFPPGFFSQFSWPPDRELSSLPHQQSERTKEVSQRGNSLFHGTLPRAFSSRWLKWRHRARRLIYVKSIIYDVDSNSSSLSRIVVPRGPTRGLWNFPVVFPMLHQEFFSLRQSSEETGGKNRKNNHHNTHIQSNLGPPARRCSCE